MAGLAALDLVWLGCAGLGSDRGPTPDLSLARDIAGASLLIETRDNDLARSQAAAEAAFEEGERVAGLVLAEIDTSEIDILNRVPSHVFIDVSADTERTLTRTLAIAEESDGAFDPTIGPLLTLWGLRDGAPKRPRDFEIDVALRKVDYLDIELGEGGDSARRLSRRTEVDLGPVARGAVVDAVLESLRGAGVPAARVTWGTITGVFTGKADAPWLCAVHGAKGEAVQDLSMKTGAVASVAPQQETLAEDATRIHELMDGRTGRPAVGARWAAATAPDAASAAGYATAVFILASEAQDMVEANADLEANAELTEGGTWASSGWTAR